MVDYLAAISSLLVILQLLYTCFPLAARARSRAVAPNIVMRACYFGLASYTSAVAHLNVGPPDTTTTMARLWQSRVSLLLLGLLVSPLVSAEHSFENTAIVRTVELGGSLVHVTTTYAVRALDDGSSIYTIALGEDEHKKTSWIQAKMKGESEPLHLEHFGLNPNTYVP